MKPDNRFINGPLRFASSVFRLKILPYGFLLCAAVTSAQTVHFDPVLTPGDTLPAKTVTQVCAHKFSETSRAEHPVTSSTKSWLRWGYKLPPDLKVIWDHKIPVELNGSNSRLNVGPQLPADAHRKDLLENYLHRAVCANPPTMTLEQAQQEISADWEKAYAKYISTATAKQK